MAEVTDEQVRKAVEAEAEEDPEFLASLTEGLSSQRDVRERAARRLDVDEALLKPFKKTIKAVMTDLWTTTPGAEPETLEKAAPKPKKAEPAAPRAPAAAAPAPAAVSATAAPPKAPQLKRKRTVFRGVRYDALVTHMARDQWDTTEKRRTDGTGQVDRTYTRAGETKVYRSMLEVARAHYPELLAEAGAPAPAPHGGQNKCACEIRRVGATEWRRFASRREAARAFPGMQSNYISRLINKAPGFLAPQHIRERYEARNAVELPVAARGLEDSSDDDEDDAPTTAPRPNGELACEIRRVGDKEWRRFASRAAADGVFPGLSSQYIGRLIRNAPGSLAPLHIRERYEARDVGDESSDDDDAVATRKRPRFGAVDVRRTGEQWRRFATRDDAVDAFAEIRDRGDISELV